VKVKPGDRVRQKVEISVRGDFEAPAAELFPATILLQPDRVFPMPSIGVVHNSAADLSAFAHVRVNLDLGVADWRGQLAAGMRNAMPVELAVLIRDEAQLNSLHQAIGELSPKIARLLVFDPQTEMSNPVLLRTARRLFPELAIGGGSNKYFAELNRNRGIASDSGVLAWPVNPQTHLNDDETAVENLAGLAPTVETARTFSGDRPLCISPIAVPEFGATAAWVAICLRQLASAGAASLTFARSVTILEEIAEFAADSLVACTSSEPLACDALVLRHGDRTRAWLVSFRDTPQDVIFRGEPLSIAPYGVERIDLNQLGR
jgi:hypothetical protein